MLPCPDGFKKFAGDSSGCLFCCFISGGGCRCHPGRAWCHQLNFLQPVLVQQRNPLLLGPCSPFADVLPLFLAYRRRCVSTSTCEEKFEEPPEVKGARRAWPGQHRAALQHMSMWGFATPGVGQGTTVVRLRAFGLTFGPLQVPGAAGVILCVHPCPAYPSSRLLVQPCCLPSRI